MLDWVYLGGGLCECRKKNYWSLGHMQSEKVNVRD